MSLRRIRLVPIATALMSVGFGHAAGIGDINVRSTIGQPLRAEISVLASPDERLREACFQLTRAPSPDNEIPTVTNGDVRLVTRSGQSHLVITTKEPVSHPVMRLNLRVGCDVGMTREYTLLMPAPVELPVAASSTESGKSDYSARAPAIGEWQTVEGESLQSISEALYPGDRRLQQRFTRAAIAANRDLFDGQRNTAHQPLPQGLRLSIPSLQTGTSPVAQARQATGETQRSKPRRPQQPAKMEEREASPGTISPSDRPHPILEQIRAKQVESDRLQVGAAPAAAVKSGERPPQAPTHEEQLVAQLEDRIAAYQAVIDKIHKMEAFADELKREVDRLDVEITSATFAQARTAISPVSAAAVDQHPATPAMPIDTVPAVPDSHSYTLPDWLLGTLAGGAAICVMAFLSRRRSIGARPTLENPTLPMPEQGSLHSEELRPMPDIESWAAARTPSASPDSNVLPFAPRDEETAIDVSEHESAMELAEIMLSFGRIKGAAQVLSDYLESNPRGAIEPWLKLLELYREAGMRHEFEEGAERLNRLYNVSVLRWEDKYGDGGLQSLERFAHIRDRLVTSWGTADCLEYLKRLMDDNRNGSRSGFALPVLDEILLLISILEEQRSAAQLEKVGKAA